MSFSILGAQDKTQKKDPTMKVGPWSIVYEIYQQYNRPTKWNRAFYVCYKGNIKNRYDREDMTDYGVEILPYLFVSRKKLFERFLERVDRYENYTDLEIVCRTL